MSTDLLVKWLKSAHAMEESIAKILEDRIDDAKEYPEMSTGLDQHLTETQQQAERLEADIERLGDSISKTRQAASKTGGSLQSLMTGFGDDKLIDNTISNIALENYEIAMYLTLIELADAVGETETKQVCQQNFEEERDMADWLEDNLCPAVQMYLAEQVEEE